eukprot:g1577.t1
MAHVLFCRHDGATYWVLLQMRGRAVNEPSTLGFPGGALEASEKALSRNGNLTEDQRLTARFFAAMREAVEEAGANGLPSAFAPSTVTCVQHPPGRQTFFFVHLLTAAEADGWTPRAQPKFRDEVDEAFGSYGYEWRRLDDVFRNPFVLCSFVSEFFEQRGRPFFDEVLDQQRQALALNPRRRDPDYAGGGGAGGGSHGRHVAGSGGARECTFGNGCTRADCYFWHPEGRKMDAAAAEGDGAGMLSAAAAAAAATAIASPAPEQPGVVGPEVLPDLFRRLSEGAREGTISTSRKADAKQQLIRSTDAAGNVDSRTVAEVSRMIATATEVDLMLRPADLNDGAAAEDGHDPGGGGAAGGGDAAGAQGAEGKGGASAAGVFVGCHPMDLVLSEGALALFDYPDENFGPSTPYQYEPTLGDRSFGRSFGDGSTATSAASLERTLLALDCEMVQTEDERDALARVTLVDSSGTVVLDELVRPSGRIVDYRTPYSGITPAMMETTSTTLAEVRARLVRLIHADAILVGHSLENDLHATKIIHRRVVDTAELSTSPKWPMRRLSLKVLVRTLFGRAIQNDAAAGHDSAEDARAALSVARFAVEHGKDSLRPAFIRVPSRRHMGRIIGHRGAIIRQLQEKYPRAVMHVNQWPRDAKAESDGEKVD